MSFLILSPSFWRLSDGFCTRKRRLWQFDELRLWPVELHILRRVLYARSPENLVAGRPPVAFEIKNG
jgi:hypothetical protein